MTSCGHWVAPEHLSASVCKSQCRILMFLQICNSVCLIMQKVPCVLVKISVSYLSASFKWWSTRDKTKINSKSQREAHLPTLLQAQREQGTRTWDAACPGRHWGSHTRRREPGLGFGSQIRPHEAEKVGRRGTERWQRPELRGPRTRAWSPGGRKWKKEGEGRGQRDRQKPARVSKVLI